LSVLTSFLKLFKYQSSDDASTFNIDVSLNDNWDKVDEAVSKLDTDKSDTTHTHTAADVGADPAGTGAAAAQQVQSNLQTHQADAVKHVTATERTTWNGKANASHMQAIADGGTNANTAAGARSNLDTMKPVWAEVTLPATGWTAAAATMKGYPNVGLKKSTDTAAASLEKEAFALIETVDTADGSITATCGDTAPQVAITLLFAGGVA